MRIYNYLSKCNWKPDSEVAKMIWIPNLNQIGEWVSPEECVLHDKDGLFSSQLKVLDKYFETELLDFFSNAFGVGKYPSVDNYCNLWKVWESSGHRLSHADCCKFWSFVSKHGSAETLAHRLVKLPVGSSDSDRILLSNKHDVWCPQPSMPSLPPTKLLEIYRKVGVRTISESVQKEESSSVDVAKLNPVNPNEFLITKGLVMLILGFLANPVIKMEAKRRHETIQRLLNVTFLETVEPITVNYSLSLSSGEIVNARASKIIH